MNEQYKILMADLEQPTIDYIQKFIDDNKITYSCNSEDFILGLMAGIKVGSELMYGKLSGDDMEYDSDRGIDLFKSMRSLKKE